MCQKSVLALSANALAALTSSVGPASEEAKEM